MWLGLGVLLLVIWGAAKLFFHVAGAAVHLLVVAALVAVAIYAFQRFRGRHARSTA